MKEGTPIVPGTINDEHELITEIEYLNDKHHILDTLSVLRLAFIDNLKEFPPKGYALLKLYYEKRTLEITFFLPSQAEEANAAYSYMEQKREDDKMDVVLVRADSLQALRAAYPNYFLDIGEFVGIIRNYLK